MMKKLGALLAAFLLVLGLGLVVPTAATAAPYCGITWGSLAKTSAPMTTAPITNVRAGQHPCFDRMVVDIRGKGAGYRVEYVSAVRADGSGQLIPLRGGAFLRVIVKAPSYDRFGNATYRPANPSELVNLAGYATFRQLASAGSFEGQSTFGLGVRARLPFRVFTLDGPGTASRLVVDVAHRW